MSASASETPQTPQPDDDEALLRRWGRIDLWVAVVMLVGLLALAGHTWWNWPDARSDREVAESVVGEDLTKLTDKNHDRVLEALRHLAGKDYWQEPKDGSPHRLYRWPTSNRWILIVTYKGGNFPGAISWMAIHQFDPQWRQTSVSRFGTGYRIALLDVWKEHRKELSCHAIVVRLGSMVGKYTYSQRQYYAFHGGRIALTRIEKEDGTIERGFFTSKRPSNGPVPPGRSVDQWIDSLEHLDPVVVLETLTWLGGYHLSATKPREEGVDQETVEDSRLWEEVLNDSRTKEVLRRLEGSDNAWIRAAAKLVSDA